MAERGPQIDEQNGRATVRSHYTKRSGAGRGKGSEQEVAVRGEAGEVSTLFKGVVQIN